MKKRLLTFIIGIILIVSAAFFHHISTNAENSSYYSEKNAPEFYGLTKATIQLNDNFSTQDAKYRIFAKDFEDGDLTNKIIVTKNNVDTSQTGKYTVSYEVTDSHNNKTELDVTIEVVDNDEGRYYERTLYTLPSVANMSAAGTNRGNNHDRQMLGLYMSANSKIEIKKINGNKDLTLTYLNNDGNTEKSYTIKNEYVEITSEYSGVPFIKTIYETDEPVVIGIKENDKSVNSLTYYHYLDDEDVFFEEWENNKNDYAVVESEDLTVLVPFYDRDKMVNYFNNCFETLDDFFVYWDKVMDRYDEFLGLSYNPDNPLDQNVKTKYFVKANIHGAGSAYYAWDHVGINSKSVASFFEVNWGGLHEVGHGYQGSLKNDLEQGEVSNNILGYYIQTDKSIYKYNGNWLGEISQIESNYQIVRENGNDYFDLPVSGRLYFVINLLEYEDAKETYAEINKLWRRSLNSGENISAMDAYALAFYKLYNVNIVSYFESWGLEVSEKVKEEVSDGDILSMIYDVSKEDASLIQSVMGTNGKYSLIKNEDLNKFNLTGSLNLTISIDNLEEIIGKKLIIKNGTYEKEVIIDSNNINLDMNIGTYEIILPVPINNTYEYTKYNYVTITNNEVTNVELSYSSFNNKDLTIEHVIELRGIGDWKFADISFNSDKTLQVNTYSGQPHYYISSTYASIDIYDLEDKLVYSKTFIGTENYTKEVVSLNYEYGYKIVITHIEGNGRLVINNSILENSDKTLTTSRDSENTYIIGRYGLYQEEDKQYSHYLDKLNALAEKLEEELTKDELSNKNLRTEEKRMLLLSILQLEENDKEKYLEKYKYIYNGSSPVLVNNEITIKENEKLDLYSVLKVTDIEDGIIKLNSKNSEFNYSNITKLVEGTYIIPYIINDSDLNIITGNITLVVLKAEVEDNNDNNVDNDNKNDENEKEDISQDDDQGNDSIEDNIVSDSNNKFEEDVKEDTTSNKNDNSTSDKTDDKFENNANSSNENTTVNNKNEILVARTLTKSSYIFIGLGVLCTIVMIALVFKISKIK